jgi:hypothetical protein
MSTSTQYRPIYLLCYPSAKFKAHWAIFVPELQDRSVKKGKLIHVQGTVSTGFAHEIKRNYDMKETRNQPHTPIEIGLVPAHLIVDNTGDGSYTSDCTPQDSFEEFLLSIPAPGKSLNTVAEGNVSVRCMRIDLRLTEVTNETTVVYPPSGSDCYVRLSVVDHACCGEIRGVWVLATYAARCQ